MCGRYASARSADELLDFYTAHPAENFSALAPSWNIAPTSQVYLIRNSLGKAERELTTARWGLTPQWAKSLDFSAKTINARVETVATKPSFRDAFKSRRCLIPADGYFEWYTASGPISRKQPFYIHNADGTPITFAGLFEEWNGVLTTTIITRPAIAQLQEVHDRMPVILGPSEWGSWVDSTVKNPEELVDFSAGIQNLAVYPVSFEVNSSRNNGPGLIHPVPAEIEQVLW